MELLKIPHVQLRHNVIVGYDLIKRDGVSVKRMVNMLRVREGYTDSAGTINPKRYSGIVTQGMQKRIKKAVDLLIQTSTLNHNQSWTQQHLTPKKLVFVTLTIPDNTISTEQERKAGQCLEKFLRWMRLKQKMKSYIWKVERQQRGALHYHITTNVYVSHVQIRKKWNEFIATAGLMTSYASTYGDTNPNSTDVHAVYKCKDVAAYLAKYLSKTDQNEVPVKGKVWDCSLNLKASKRFDFLEDSAYKKRVADLIESKKIEFVQGERFYMLKGNSKDLLSTLSLTELQNFDRWTATIRNYERIVQRKSNTSTTTDNTTTTLRPVSTPPVSTVKVQSNRPSQSAQSASYVQYSIRFNGTASALTRLKLQV